MDFAIKTIDQNNVFRVLAPKNF